MRPPSDRRDPAGPSPLIDPETIADLGHHSEPPPPHTAVELGSVVNLLLDLDPRATTVAVGHSRDAASRDAAQAFVTAWRGRGEVTAIVHWPESAASWLRPAQRLIAHDPDAWVIAAAPLGFAQLVRRLGRTATWNPARTVAFASVCDPRLPVLAGADTLHGLRGATGRGDIWTVRHGWVSTQAERPSPLGRRSSR